MDYTPFTVTSLIIVSFLLVLRSRSMLKSPTARPAWFASLFAVISFTLMGIYIPTYTLDQVLGGPNRWDIIGSITVAAAFWCMYWALSKATLHRIIAREYIPVIIIMTISTVSYIQIEGTNTTPTESITDFQDTFINQPATLIFIMVYLSAILYISVLTLLVAGKQYKKFRVFIFGYVAVVVSIPIDYVYLVMHHLDADEGIRQVFWIGYTALFFPGVIAIAIGFLHVYLKNLRNRINLRWRMKSVRLGRINARIQGVEPDTWSAFFSSSPMAESYRQVIQIRDQQLLSNKTLLVDDLTVVEEIEESFERKTELHKLQIKNT